MQIFRVDSAKLSHYLKQRGFSYQDLADRLSLKYAPTKRTVEEIKKGRVPARWRKPLSALVGVPAKELYLSGRVRPKYMDLVANANIASITITHNLSKAAIGAWMDEDGGIEPEHLDALARLLNTKPVELTAPQTVDWMKSFVAGGVAMPPRG